MSSLAIALIVLACVFGSALLGQRLRAVLPEAHLSADAKDVMKLATGLVATMSALFLCALAATGAILLILEMDRPLDGLIRISSVPLRDALAHLGQ